MGQRYAVLPLQAPHLEGDGRGFGRGYRGGRGYQRKYPQDKQKENSIKKDVEQVLLDKFENSDQWTEEQKKGIKNTLKAQVKVYADMILEQAEEECYSKLLKSDESISVEEQQKVFYKKLYSIAMDIAEKQFEIDEDFDIEEAIKRERNVLKKVQNGELTRNKAISYLEEPLLFKGEIDNKYKQYVNLYNNFVTKKREEASKENQEEVKPTETTRRERQTENNTKGRAQNTREQPSSNRKPEGQAVKDNKVEESKEYLQIQTVRRNGREEAGVVKGSFINLGIHAQRLILKIYEKIPKVFRDPLEEFGKNGSSRKLRYLFAGAIISDRLSGSRKRDRENSEEEIEINFREQYHYGPCHHHEPHYHDHEPHYHDEPCDHDHGPEHEEI